ncbi:MAG: SOS response-associated peptidase family protein [Gracilimonas sp.]|uniref:SOS response-associated peptidase n=1 Tax=Gracilimonas sp. TaxID=1974203 RepID=UPI0019B8D12B|nr:SOS response-associated peptidase family protein [Gracilimonas sp.]MBD3617545.1 SOS response-associated peptidase family protein [Gracilimonas sp.]
MKRYVLEAEKSVIEETFGVKSNSDSLFEPNYNVISGNIMPIVIPKGEGRQIVSSVWGLKQDGKEKILVEADHEKVLKKDTLKELVVESPCIIPASGFYKWKETVDDPLPFYLRVLSQEVSGFAGIFSSYKNKEGRTLHSFAVLTMPANVLVEPLDHTMPVILDPKEYDQWLTGEGVRMLKKGFSGNHLLPDMSVFRVPELVNDPANNSKELIQPIPKLRNYDVEDEG